MSSAQQWNGLKRPVNVRSMERIMTGTGLGSCSSNRCVLWQEKMSMASNKTLLQLTEKIIPAFEEGHGPGYQALIMVDNSQGHSAYAEDALLVNHMNMKPAGKQAHMWDGWYVWDGNRITQSRVFPANHPDFPNMPKGMKQILHECGIDTRGLRMICKEKCHGEATSCCTTRTWESQPDFKAQKSLVQEVIEAAGHLCIFYQSSTAS